MPPRTPRQLLDQAAEVRGRAAILHKAADQEHVNWEKRRDDARRDVRLAERDAKEADTEAKDRYDEGQWWTRQAADEQLAGQRLAASRPADAEEHFEAAQRNLRHAASQYAQADVARQRARDMTLKAEEAVKQVEVLDTPPFPPREIQALDWAADMLDENAQHLTSAADHLRKADTARAAGDFADAQEHEIWATANIDQAAEPSLRDVAPEVLRRYGYSEPQASLPTDDPVLAATATDDPVLAGSVTEDPLLAEDDPVVPGGLVDDQVADAEDPLLAEDFVAPDAVAVAELPDFAAEGDELAGFPSDMDMEMQEDVS